jgi:hypothetical protein
LFVEDYFRPSHQEVDVFATEIALEWNFAREKVKKSFGWVQTFPLDNSCLFQILHGQNKKASLGGCPLITVAFSDNFFNDVTVFSPDNFKGGSFVTQSWLGEFIKCVEERISTSTQVKVELNLYG